MPSETQECILRQLNYNKLPRERERMREALIELEDILTDLQVSTKKAGYILDLSFEEAEQTGEGKRKEDLWKHYLLSDHLKKNNEIIGDYMQSIEESLNDFEILLNGLKREFQAETLNDIQELFEAAEQEEE